MSWFRPIRPEQALRSLTLGLPTGTRVLDVGCGEAAFAQFAAGVRDDLLHHGCDRAAPETPPPGYAFAEVDLDGGALPYPDDHFDAIVCAHVIEHLARPIDLVRECVRVLKPGGQLYIEAPSDRALGFSLGGLLHWRLILSYWDDPTHTGRPWTPQALYRLAAFAGLDAKLIRYDTCLVDKLASPFALIDGALRRDPDRIVSAWWRATGWVVFAWLAKPADACGAQGFRYRSYKGAGIGAPLPSPRAIAE